MIAFDAVAHAKGIVIQKIVGGADLSAFGAFRKGEALTFRLFLPRAMGVSRVEWVAVNDANGKENSFDAEFCRSAFGVDEYTLDFPDAVLEGGIGLVYYQFRFWLSDGSFLKTQSRNNVDFEVVWGPQQARMFRLVLYDQSFTVPSWMQRAVMYQIFVDRFAKSQRQPPCREDAVINPDWENGTPEFGKYPGAPLKNNEFFGGTLYGAADKLAVLKELGVTCVYLNPIFKAYSNHKYDTGDYLEIDEMFGGQDGFSYFLDKAHENGMRVVLDGVFNHTGNDSRYFNEFGRYDTVGAYQSKASPYYSWYTFRSHPNDYESWWNIKILPKLNLRDPTCKAFFVQNGGVVQKYIADGCAGWRLDVADELPAEFLEQLRTAVKAQDSDACIIGEVWENASDKIAYGERRRYLWGKQLDSVMNYPWRNAIIDFIRTGNETVLYDSVTEIYGSYPKMVSDALMNLLGTHDTERILTVLGTDGAGQRTNDELAVACMSHDERAHAAQRLLVASTLEFTLPGMPCIFYGDEAGMEGYHDPFCRKPYPWGRQDAALFSHYQKLCSIKTKSTALQGGAFRVLFRGDGLFAFERTNEAERLIVAANCSGRTRTFLPDGEYFEWISGTVVTRPFMLEPMTASIFVQPSQSRSANVQRAAKRRKVGQARTSAGLSQ